MSGRSYRDREEAGDRLAKDLAFLKGRRDVVVLAVPRGGVVVARPIAESLAAPLDLIIVKKVGAPGNPELAVGAVTQDGELIVDDEMVRTLRVSEDFLNKEAAIQTGEIAERMKRYRGDSPYPRIEGRTVVVVDDGVATGSTLRAAVRSVRRGKAAEIILAVPVGSRQAIAALSKIVERVICPSIPEPFFAIGEFYDSFDQVEDETVRGILTEASKRVGG